MKTIKDLINTLFVIGSAFLISACAQNRSSIPTFDWMPEADRPDISWISQVGAKTFPEKKVFNVNPNGINDGKTLCTEIVQKAIDDCHDAGGGIVMFAPGQYLVGALFVKSGVNLQIDKGVTLMASQDIVDFPEIPTRIAGIEMVWPSAVINVLDQQNVAISGKGTIDCRGEVWWEKYRTMRKDYEKRGLRWIVDYDCKRVRGMLISNCTDVTFRDFTLKKSGFWSIQVLYSNQCTVSGVTINNNIPGNRGPSTDGIDIDSSERILIDGCSIDCNDDNICIKAGRDADGLRVNRPSEYVVVRNCTAYNGGGLIVCGSETSGGIRNVVGYNLKSFGTSAVFRMKSAITRGGTVENIFVDNVEADSINTIFAADLNWNPAYSYSLLPPEYNECEIPTHWQTMLTEVKPKELGYPHFKNIYLSNVKATNTDAFVNAVGWSDSLRIENFRVYNVTSDVKNGGKVAYSDNFIFSNVKLTTENKIVFENNIGLQNKGIEYKK